MGTDKPNRCRAHQPELPMPIVPPPASSQPTPDSHPHEWRLDEPGLLIEPPFVWMTVGCRLAGGRRRHDRQRQFGLVGPASVWFVGSHGYSMARGCITGS